MNHVRDIDLSGLYKLIDEALGAPGCKPVITVKDNRYHNTYLDVDSDDIKHLCGVMAPTFKEVRIRNFGGSTTEDKKGYWLQINFCYDLAAGGCNSSEILTALYSFKTKTWRRLK